MKDNDRLGLGVQGDGVAWLTEARQMLDFNLKRLAHRARSGRLEAVRLEAGTLIVTPTAGEVPAAAEELNAEICDMYPMVRLRNLKDRKFYTFEKGGTYPALSNHIGAPINATLILDHWDDLLHLSASITTRAVVPSTILKKLSASPKESQIAKALRELGRIERFMIEWYSSPAPRRRCQAGLNKGEAAHKLKRAVFPHPQVDPLTSWFSCCLRLDDLESFDAACRSSGIPEVESGQPDCIGQETKSGVAGWALSSILMAPRCA